MDPPGSAKTAAGENEDVIIRTDRHEFSMIPRTGLHSRQGGEKPVKTVRIQGETPPFRLTHEPLTPGPGITSSSEGRSAETEPRRWRSPGVFRFARGSGLGEDPEIGLTSMGHGGISSNRPCSRRLPELSRLLRIGARLS